jgi:subtilisin-like proprotein convertase family protein
MPAMKRGMSLVWLVCAFAFASIALAQAKGPIGYYPVSGKSDLSQTRHVLYGFVPNDPYFPYDSLTGYTGQWNLQNQTPAGGPDANVLGAWNRNITGSGVTIGIVDDCLERSHPDLSPNYVSADSWDFGQSDNDPSPVWSTDQHGISVAGVAAARGGNGIGATGVAPYAGLAGLRVDFSNQSEAMFAGATLYHSSGANTSIKIKNHSYGFEEPYIQVPDEVNALAVSAAAGTIHNVAAGNERAYHGYAIDVNNNGIFDPDIDRAVDGDANKKALPGSTNAIAVAALGANGKYASYSDWGANIFVTAPSSGLTNYGITTTDRTGSLGYNTAGTSPDLPNTDYTSQFGGTSAATPLISGVMALGKQVNPNLDVRMAKHLLALSSTLIDPTDNTSHGGWVTNSAGYHFNEDYGFGLVNADVFTQLAAQVTGLSGIGVQDTGSINVGIAIPDANLNGISRSFTFSGTGKLEDVLVHLDVTHPYRGDIEAFLTSPGGTTSQLMYRNGADSWDNFDWTFDSNAFWGENPQGTWNLIVRDYFGGDVGTWNSFDVTANLGALVMIPEPVTYAHLMCVMACTIGWFYQRRRKTCLLNVKKRMS